MFMFTSLSLQATNIDCGEYGQDFTKTCQEAINYIISTDPNARMDVKVTVTYTYEEEYIFARISGDDCLIDVDPSLVRIGFVGTNIQSKYDWCVRTHFKNKLNIKKGE